MLLSPGGMLYISMTTPMLIANFALQIEVGNTARLDCMSIFILQREREADVSVHSCFLASSTICCAHCIKSQWLFCMVMYIEVYGCLAIVSLIEHAQLPGGCIDLAGIILMVVLDMHRSYLSSWKIQWWCFCLVHFLRKSLAVEQKKCVYSSTGVAPGLGNLSCVETSTSSS
jgi:hypothetical protein